MATGTAESATCRGDAETCDPAKDPVRFLLNVQEFARCLHATLDSQEIAAIAANDGRQLLACDRLSVVVCRGPHPEVTSISGQDRINPRANQVRLLATLAAQALPFGHPFLFAGSDENLPPQLIQPLSDYLLESGARSLMIVPLSRPEPTPVLLESPPPRKRPQPFGALILEQFHNTAIGQTCDDRVGLVAEQVEIALWNGLTHEQVLFLPLRRFLGRQLAWMQGRRLVKLLVAALAVAAIAGGLLATPADYRVEGRGRLMPSIRREVFAPRSGEVIEVCVTNGVQVAAGTKLLQLRNDDLHAQLLACRNRQSEKLQLQQSLRAEFDEASRSGSRSEWIRLKGKLTQIKSDLEGEAEQIRLLEEQNELLTVRAPIAGTVTTFQPEQLLLNRPVQRGEALLEVMDEAGPWRLELNVPEYRMGHLLTAQRQNETPLPVEFVPAAAPEMHYAATLEQVATRAAVSAREGTIVEVYATPLPGSYPEDRGTVARSNADRATGLASLPPAQRRIGAEVHAKIACGRCSLAYVLFGDLLEFLQKQLWF